MDTKAYRHRVPWQVRTSINITQTSQARHEAAEPFLYHVQHMRVLD